MMNWKQFEQDVFDYIDGLLPAHAKKAIDKQLQEDPECLKFYNEIKLLRSQLKNLQPVKASSDFETVLRTRISMERSISRRGFLNGPKMAPVFAAVGAMALIVAFFVYKISDIQLLKNNVVTSSNFNSSFPSFKTDTNNSIKAVQDLPRTVNYPMDQVNLTAGGGTSIDSRSLERQSRSKSDSSKGDLAKPLVTVEF